MSYFLTLFLQVLFRFALAIFKLCEDWVLGQPDYMEIFNYLRSVPEPVADITKLREVSTFLRYLIVL